MEYTDYGALSIKATGANAFPVENALVRIRGASEENRFIEYSRVTDEDGATQKVYLPAPRLADSLAPSPPEAPYAIYDVQVSKEGYYTSNFYGVSVFPGIYAILPVNMIPLRENKSESIDSTITQNEKLLK